MSDPGEIHVWCREHFLDSHDTIAGIAVRVMTALLCDG